MAINTNNDELNQYNDLLRDSINYSKQLSDNILALAGRMSLVSIEGRRTRAALSDINKNISKTLQLSDKLNQGKLKQKDIEDQITKLQNDYNTYINETVNGLNNINELYQNQSDLGNDITANLNKQATINADINSLLQQHASLSQQLNAISTNPNLAGQATLLRDQLKDVNNSLNIKERSLDIEKRINKELNEQLNKTDTALEAHERLLEIYTLELEKAEKIKAALEAQNHPASRLAQTFKDVQGILGAFMPIFNFLKSVAFDVSNQVTQLQKGLMLSSDEAYQVRSEFNDLAVASGNVLITTNALVASNAELGKQLGFNARFSNDAVIEFTKLTKQIGLSEEAAGGLAKLSSATGTTLEETKITALGVSQALSSQYGIQLDQREVLEEVGKISGQTLAMFKGSVPALTQAVAQAKLLGTNLETAKKQASALLDFESSIENELQAELITGQQFNLERARSASLTGDLTTVMKELNNQGIDFNKFSNMNVIAQEKLAAAFGLQTDELSDQLLKQQYMNMSREQVVALAGEEVAKRLEAVSAQDKFNAAMEKMKDLFANIAGGPLGQLAEMMAGLLDNSAALYGIMAAIAGISFVKLIASLVTTAATLASSAVAGGALAAFINPTSLIIGIAALATLGALIGSAMTDASEAAQPIGDMSYANGKTLISTAEGGLFEPSPNDEIAVAPGISDMINRSQTSSTVVQQDNSAVVNAINTLITEAKNTNSGLAQLNAKKSEIKVDSQNFGTTQLIGTYTLA
jgi:uncharacterized coiled-coil DUF342 family protein